MKTADLIDAQLDYWVAMSMGLEVDYRWSRYRLKSDRAPEYDGEPYFAWIIEEGWSAYPDGFPQIFSPSTDWTEGGEIIEQDKIDISAPDPFDDDQRWFALLWLGRSAATVSGKFSMRGDTPLIAAMRCKVASVYGDTVPDEVLA